MATKVKRKKVSDLETMDLAMVDVWGKHVFNEDEKRDISKKLAAENCNKKHLEDEKKAVASSYKAKIDACVSNINLYSDQITNGYEHRNFKCFRVLNFKRKMREHYCVDTGVLVSEEPMTSGDYQHKLNFNNKKKKKKEANA